LAAPPFSCQQFLINSISTFTTWDPTVNYLAGQVVFYSVDGRYYNALDVSFDIVPGTDEAIWDRIGTPQLVNAPWDPTFIDRWTHVIQAFGARYDGNPAVAYVVISGPGTSDAEGFVAKNLNDLAELNSLGGSGIDVLSSVHRRVSKHSCSICHWQSLPVQHRPTSWKPTDQSLSWSTSDSI
jgi:hypothetical protein